MDEKQALFIQESNKRFTLNIDEFVIGQKVISVKYGVDEIVNKTSSSIQVKINKRKKYGVTHKEWFTMSDFNKAYRKSNKLKVKIKISKKTF